MKDKKGIELAVNFLVVVIISIALLVGGILLFKNLLKGTIEIKGELDKQTEAEIEHLLTQGQLVSVFPATKEIERGDSHVFGVGVLNIEEESTFQITVKYSAFIDETKKLADPEQDVGSWSLYDGEPFKLKQSEEDKKSIAVIIPEDAKKGTYLFDVQVLKDGKPYPQESGLKKITVIVK